MADSNNKQRSGFFSNAFGVAKKLSHTGLNILNQVSPDTASALTNATTGDSASTKTKSKIVCFYFATLLRERVRYMSMR